MKALATKYLDFIVGATNRMQLLIKDLLDYSRIGIDKKRVQLDCNLLISEVLQILQESIKSSGCEVKLGEMPTIYAYPELFSLFQNLLSNALKFRKKNEGLSIHISAIEKNNDWLFEIQDNGIGIEIQYQDRIFTLFQ